MMPYIEVVAREREMTNVSFRWPKTKVDRLARRAEKNGRSMAGEIRIILDRHLTDSNDAHPQGERS